MHSSSREGIVEAFDALEADLDRALGLCCDVLTTPELLAVLARCEKFRRQLPAVEHPLIKQLDEQADETQLGGKLPAALANRLRITRAEASQRIHEAADLGPRRTLTGQPMEPVLPATAKAQREGHLGSAHVAVIRGFWHRLPEFVDIETREMAESQLARLSGQHRPDELAKLAERGWITRMRADGVIEWIPPPDRDYGQPRTNAFHHPEKLLQDDDKDDDP